MMSGTGPDNAGRDRRWGIASIALAVAPPLIMPLLPDYAEIVGMLWLVGFGVGCLGLWERDAARKLAIAGVLMNVLVPPVVGVAWFFFAHHMMARSMPGTP
jgi:hypothetical protein